MNEEVYNQVYNLTQTDNKYKVLGRFEARVVSKRPVVKLQYEKINNAVFDVEINFGGGSIASLNIDGSINYFVLTENTVIITIRCLIYSTYCNLQLFKEMRIYSILK